MKLSFENSNINFYFSFQCPYSYIVWKTLCDLLQNNKDISVNPINIGLNPNGNKYSFRELWDGQRWLKLSNEAKTKGIIISKPLKIVSENLAARCIKNYGVSSAEYYISTIFKAVFTSGIDISIPSNLRYFLQSEGNESSILSDAANDNETLTEYEKQTDLWGIKRIRLTPTIELGNERLSGLINKLQLENLLRPLIE